MEKIYNTQKIIATNIVFLHLPNKVPVIVIKMIQTQVHQPEGTITLKITVISKRTIFVLGSSLIIQ